jgi:DNA-binding NarL/FixJ family response regulator
MRREAVLRGLIYSDDAVTRRAVTVIMDRRGFDVVGEVVSAADAMEATERTRPHAIVLDLALTGVLGLGMLGRLMTAAPGCSILVLSAFDELHPAALDAGAYQVVSESDLRELERCLARVADEALEESCARTE